MIIVNETLARRHWPDGDALGKRIRFYGPPGESSVDGSCRHRSGREARTESAGDTDYYTPHAQDPWNAMVLVARTTVEPGSMAGPIRQQVLAIDKDQPVYGVYTMNEVRAISVTLYTFAFADDCAIFAAVALVLAAIGSTA